MLRRQVRLPDLPMGREIPRSLHQIFLQGEAALPAPIREVRDCLRAANPDWAYTLWDTASGEAIIAETYGDAVLRRFRRIAPEYHAARSDLLRYLVLYARGGVYLDLKSTCDRPLDEAILSGDRYLVMQWNPDVRTHHPELSHVETGEHVQWALASVRGHPILREVIEHVLRNIDRYSEWRFGTGYFGTLRLTGPIAYTLVVEQVRTRHPHSYVTASSERGFIYSGLERTDAHFHLYDKHYTALKTPMVEPSPVEAALVRGVRWIKRVPPGAAAVRWLRAVLQPQARR
jgi:inositol phosphorylceramide mannosyltransferase catalytic subunit